MFPFKREAAPRAGTACSCLRCSPCAWNRYQYVVNDPLAAIDPDGNTEVTIAPPPAKTLAVWTDERSRTKVALRNVPLGERITRFNFTVLGNRTAGAMAGVDLIRMPVLIPAYRNWSKGYQDYHGHAPTGFTFLAWYVGGAPRNFAPPPGWLRPTPGIH